MSVSWTDEPQTGHKIPRFVGQRETVTSLDPIATLLLIQVRMLQDVQRHIADFNFLPEKPPRSSSANCCLPSQSPACTGV